MQKYAEEEKKKLSLTSESTSHKSCFVIFFALGFDAKAACNACRKPHKNHKKPASQLGQHRVKRISSEQQKQNRFAASAGMLSHFFWDGPSNHGKDRRL